MKMKKLSVFLSLLILLIAACSNETIIVEEDDIIGVINQNQLTVFNNSDQNIFYTVFDQSILAFILWAPISSDENKLPGFSKKTFQISDILAGGKTRGSIVFYFWMDEEPDGETIKFVTFEVSE